MKKVLIVTENPEEQDYLRSRLSQEDTLQVATANPRQINPINLKKIRQSDVIILTESLPLGCDRMSERLLTTLKQTGVPIILLPMVQGSPAPREDSLILNLTDERLAQSGVAGLITKIRHLIHPDPLTEEGGSYLQGMTSTQLPPSSHQPATPEEITVMPTPAQRNKFTTGLLTLGRLTKQLREPLSNMNLAIHMLERVESLEERDRYLRLLREEYQRELQLVSELETLQTSLESFVHLS